MLTWLAKKFEKNRAGLQARLENSLQNKVSSSPPVVSVDWRKRGNEFLSNEMLADAEACFRKGILADAKDSVCYSNLGYVLVNQGRWEEAERMLGHAIALNPADSDALYLLGNSARDRRELVRAIACYQKALSINPGFALCRSELCLVLAQSVQLQEARKVLDQGPSFDPDSAQYHHFKGVLHLHADEFGEAIDCFQTAKQLYPKHPDILLGLCNALIKQHDMISALETGRQILELQPENSQAYDLMAVAYQFIGQYDRAIESHRKALQINPQYVRVRQNLLFSLSHLSGYSPLAYLLEAKEWAENIRVSVRPYSSWLCSDHASKPRALRVGFVSGDLRYHPVGKLLERVLPFLDSEDITCIAYSNSAEEDPCTEHLKSMFSEWTQVTWMQDKEMAHKIHADRIDVLVDLAGHTGQNRLPVFAWRPAPLQVAWFGYGASTGLTEMDYILVDKVSAREDEAQAYSEKLWFLPDTRFCFFPPVTASPIAVGTTPALRKGYITFGSFQSLRQITDAVLNAWSEILARLPTARLRLQSAPLSFPECVSDMRRRLNEARIQIDRVDLIGGTSLDGYLAAYSEVDLVLDTFPFPGRTTTAEALCMGVPTVTLSGDTLLSRQGDSILCCVGLSDWVAADERSYINLALEKAADPSSLDTVRANLRNIALTSRLFDGATFAKNLQYALRHMAKRHLHDGAELPLYPLPNQVHNA